LTVHDRSKASAAELQRVRGAPLLLVAAAASGDFDLLICQSRGAMSALEAYKKNRYRIGIVFD